MKKILALTFAVMLCTTVRSQTPPVVSGPPADPITVKDTPASQSLDKLAKEEADNQKTVNDLFQQARHNLDANQKALQDEIKKQTKDLNDKLAEDKKYKPIMDKIKDLNKQLQDIQGKAQADFQKNAGVLQQKVQSAMYQVEALIPVVRKENGLPETAQYNPQTQKWTVPKAEAKK